MLEQLLPNVFWPEIWQASLDTLNMLIGSMLFSAATTQLVARARAAGSAGSSASDRAPMWSTIAPDSNRRTSPSTSAGTWPNGCSRR